MKKTSAAASSRSIPENYRAVCLACLAGALTIAAVLFVAALVISSVDFPQSAIAPIAIGASVAGCLLAGFLCARMTKSAGLVYGLICGAILFFLCLLCEVSFLGGELGMLAVYKFAVCVVSAMIGGVLGVNRRRKIH